MLRYCSSIKAINHLQGALTRNTSRCSVATCVRHLPPSQPSIAPGGSSAHTSGSKSRTRRVRYATETKPLLMILLELLCALCGLARHSIFSLARSRSNALRCRSLKPPRKLSLSFFCLEFLLFFAAWREMVFDGTPTVMLADNGIRPRHEGHPYALDRQFSPIDQAVR